MCRASPPRAAFRRHHDVNVHVHSRIVHSNHLEHHDLDDHAGLPEHDLDVDDLHADHDFDLDHDVDIDDVTKHGRKYQHDHTSTTSPCPTDPTTTTTAVPSTNALNTRVTSAPATLPSASAASDPTGGTGAPTLKSTGAGNVLAFLVAGLCLVAIGILGRRLLLGLAHRTKRTRQQ
jgi:hypothetical protein